MFDTGVSRESAVFAPSVYIEAARASRSVEFSRLNPALLVSLPRDLVREFARQETPLTQPFFFGEPEVDSVRIVERLTEIIGQPDMVDIATRLNPDQDIEAVIPAVWQYAVRMQEYLKSANPLLPKDVVNQTDLSAYLACCLPVRPGREDAAVELFHAMVAGNQQCPGMGNFLYENERGVLSANTLEAVKAVTSAAETALELSQNDPVLRDQTVEAVIQAVHAQDKWWVFGVDEPDPLTVNLLGLLEKYQVPEASEIILDTLFRKAEQDKLVVAAVLLPQDWDLKWHGFKFLTPAMDQFFNLAIRGDKTKTQKFIFDHSDATGISRSVLELLAARTDLHQETITLGSEREGNYFGRKFRFEGLPEGESITLTECTNWILAARDATGKVRGLYNLDPGNFTKGDEVLTVQADPVEKVLFWSTNTARPITDDRLQQFFTDLPKIERMVNAHIAYAGVYNAYPMPIYYQLWEYLQSQDAGAQEMVGRFLEEFGINSLFPFLCGEYNQRNIPLVMKFALENQTPRSFDDDGIETIRMYESFPEWVLGRYSAMAMDAWEYAQRISPVPEKALALNDLILQRSKALLVAAAKMHEVRGGLTEEEKAYVTCSFAFNEIMLHIMADKTGKLSQKYQMSYDLVRDFFILHDPSDPDSRELFASAMDLWFKIYTEKQKGAEYAGKVEELTGAFYQAYEELEKDSGQTTADPVLERTRYFKSLENDIACGVLPEPKKVGRSVKICFVGVGNARMEAPIVALLKGKDQGYRFFGIDIEKPQDIPPDIEFHRLNMKDLSREMPGKFDRIMLIWSPYMDVIELGEMLEVAASLTSAGTDDVEIEIDVAFPFGEHSYEKIIREYNRSSPDEPVGMFFRDFSREGKPPVGKRFFAGDPTFIDYCFGRHGFGIANFPAQPSEIIEICQRTSRDDSWILDGPQNDPDRQAVYRTNSGCNRVTYKVRKLPGRAPISSLAEAGK